MRKICNLCASLALLLPFPVFAFQGSWRGNLNIGQVELPLVFNFSETESGETECTLDSPAQGAKGIATTVNYCSQDSVAVESKLIGASFSGKIIGNKIEGKFLQRGFSLPLTLTQDAPIETRRPQTPQPPFPYTVIDTVFTAPDGAVLSGTITLPADMGAGEAPAVIMVTGSGPQNRDEELFDHKPFAVIADHLARNGVASLRYDDRGVGKSTGDFFKATTFTFKDDAAAAIDFMRSMEGIGKVGVLGHSEGGTIAFMLGADQKPDFIISLAGMAVPAKEALMMQNNRQLDKTGVRGADKENSMKLISLCFDELIRQASVENTTSLDPVKIAEANGLTVPEEVLQSVSANCQVVSPWFTTFLTLYPSEYITQITCPVLAINGEKDTQVEAASNLGLIKELLPDATIQSLPDLNHMLQHADTGDVSEYISIRETISPEVLDLILSFIQSF